MVVERPFGALKGRFPILKMVRWDNIDSIYRLIITACFFHVVCLLNDEHVEGFLTQEDDVNDCQNVLPNDTRTGPRNPISSEVQTFVRSDTVGGSCSHLIRHGSCFADIKIFRHSRSTSNEPTLMGNSAR